MAVEIFIRELVYNDLISLFDCEGLTPSLTPGGRGFLFEMTKIMWRHFIQFVIWKEKIQNTQHITTKAKKTCFQLNAA